MTIRIDHKEVVAAGDPVELDFAVHRKCQDTECLICEPNIDIVLLFHVKAEQNNQVGYGQAVGMTKEEALLLVSQLDEAIDPSPEPTGEASLGLAIDSLAQAFELLQHSATELESQSPLRAVLIRGAMRRLAIMCEALRLAQK
jgi:hypothetical protein